MRLSNYRYAVFLHECAEYVYCMYRWLMFEDIVVTGDSESDECGCI